MACTNIGKGKNKEERQGRMAAKRAKTNIYIYINGKTERRKRRSIVAENMGTHIESVGIRSINKRSCCKIQPEKSKMKKWIESKNLEKNIK